MFADTNAALHFYHHDNAFTSNGVLNITTEFKVNDYRAFNEKTEKFYADKKHVQTAMVQGWNKFCYTGGIAEFKAKLPGDAGDGGLWPARKYKATCSESSASRGINDSYGNKIIVWKDLAMTLFLTGCLSSLHSSISIRHSLYRSVIRVVWLLGNLARATYVGSSDFMWPFSYNECDAKGRLSQEINACDKVNHYGMSAEFGRGSPEIDILESMQGNMDENLPNTHIKRPYQSTSLQVRYLCTASGVAR